MNEERRSHARANLHVPVLLGGHAYGVPVQTRTENVSKDGFFAYTEHPFALGDRLKFVLVLPTVSGDAETTPGMFVYGEVEVVRMNLGSPGGLYGIGCHLSTYRVLPASEWVVPEELLAKVIQEDFAAMREEFIHRKSGGAFFRRATALVLLPFLSNPILKRQTC